MASEGKNLIGVDIGSTSIKICEIKESGGERELVRFDVFELPAETVVDGQIINASAVTEGLKVLFDKQRFRRVAMRAAGNSVIIKKATVPLMTFAELEEQIGWEAEQHIPFSLQDVFLDYEVLAERQDHGQMDILIVAAKKEEITDLTNLAIEAKLQPVVVDLDAFTLQNVYETAYGPPATAQTIVLIHVGAATTTVNILADGTTAFTRDIANGGQAITDEIQRQLGVSREAAETYKTGGTGAGVVPKEVTTIVNQVCEQLAGEIQRSLDFYLATSGGRDLTRIYCSGGTANAQALRDAIAARARVPIELLDASRIFIDPNDARAKLGAAILQSPVAVGLALRKERELY